MRYCAVLLLLVLTLFSPGQSGAQQDAPTQPEQSKAKSVSAPAIAQSSTPQQQGQPDRSSKIPPLTDPFWSNWALVLVGIVAAWIALKTLGDLKEQTSTAKTSAETAELSAQAVINAERAWIMVDVDWQPDMKMAYASRSISVRLKITCRNEGRSLAWITEKWACGKFIKAEDLPERPDFSDSENIFQLEVQPLAAGKGDTGKKLDLEIPSEPNIRKSRILVVYGRVRYRTIFQNKNGETTFGFVVTGGDELMRLADKYHDYNKNA